MHHTICRATVAIAFALCGLGPRLAVAAPHACDIVPQAEVARIAGNGSKDVVRNPPVDVSGAKVTQCSYLPSTNPGNTAVITLMTAVSSAAARALMKSKGEGSVTAGGTAESESVAGLPAVWTVSKGGLVLMTVVKGDVLVMTGIRMRRDTVATERDRSRQLAAAALAGL